MSPSPRNPSPSHVAPAAGSRPVEGVAGAPAHRPISKIRDNVDALIVAFLLAMFIRMFVVELFMIPSPSMTPTLLGTEDGHSAVGFIDTNGSGVKDMVLWSERYPLQFDVFLRKGPRYYYDGTRRRGSAPDSDDGTPNRGVVPDSEIDRWRRNVSVYQDRILVAKFLYWFTPPRRGDIIVFKVPPVIYERDKPIFIKRAAGLPGETLTFDPVPGGVPGHENNMGHLVANGQTVTSPPFFAKQFYESRNIWPPPPVLTRPDCVTYADHGIYADIVQVKVPQDGVFAMGDNTVSSLDSRYWGAVPLDRLRGRALFRYNPHYFPFTKEPGFLN